MNKGYYWVECENCHFIHFWDGRRWQKSYLSDKYLKELTQKFPIKVLSLVKQI